MVQVDVEHIVKRYERTDTIRQSGGPPALDDVSLSAAEGETISLVGSSGCGKSTLLRVIAGLETVDSGRVLYNGHDVSDVGPGDRGVGMVFQDYALYPSMKGKGNLAYYFETHRRTEEEAEQRTREVADLMGIGFELLLGRLPDTLSGGEKQRVAIGRCIVREPTVFLMDEPISNLDAKLRERTRTEIKKLLRKFKITTVYVTHDQSEALFMGDRIAVMRHGRIEQLGTFDDLYYTPSTLFVARFIGSPPLAVLDAEVVDGQLAIDGARWTLPEQLSTSLAPGRLRLGVRAEGWQLDTDDGAPLEVRHIERNPTERAAFVHGRLGAGQATALAPADYPNSEVVRVTPDWDQVYLFAVDTDDVLHTPGVPDLFGAF